MCNQAPWPVRKGIFRSTGQSDFVPTRTPSPIVEFPLSPPPPQTPTSSVTPPPQHKNGIVLNVTSPRTSPRVTIVESPPPPGGGSGGGTTRASPPQQVRTTFEIPIERVKVSSAGNCQNKAQTKWSNLAVILQRSRGLKITRLLCKHGPNVRGENKS